MLLLLLSQNGRHLGRVGGLHLLVFGFLRRSHLYNLFWNMLDHLDLLLVTTLKKVAAAEEHATRDAAAAKPDGLHARLVASAQ